MRLNHESPMIQVSEKNVQIKHKKYGKGRHRNLSDHFEADSLLYRRNRTRS